MLLFTNGWCCLFSTRQEQKQFATIGQKIKSGDTICLIEAMKTFKPAKADKDGVVKILFPIVRRLV